jgi:hypothetical protein
MTSFFAPLSVPAISIVENQEVGGGFQQQVTKSGNNGHHYSLIIK